MIIIVQHIYSNEAGIMHMEVAMNIWHSLMLELFLCL